MSERIELHDSQFGSRPGRGTCTLDAVFIMRQLQEKYWKEKEEILDLCRSGKGF